MYVVVVSYSRILLAVSMYSACSGSWCIYSDIHTVSYFDPRCSV